MQVVCKNSIRKIKTSTSTVQITHFQKVDKMCLPNNICTYVCLKFFYVPGEISTVNYPVTILIQCNVGRYGELKKRNSQGI